MMAKSVRKQNVLKEDTYLEEIGKIIQRDFFPDLEKLKTQNDCLDDRNNKIKLQQIQAIYTQIPRTSSECYSSPGTFENSKAKQSFKDLSFGQYSENVVKKVSGIQNMSLDGYLSLHTSEDNQSYEEIIAESDKSHRRNHPWLYKEESLEKNDNILNNVNTLRSKQLDSWSYQDKNYLMYVPDGVELTSEEIAKHKNEIVHSNTRLKRNPFDGNKNKEILQDMAHSRAKLLVRKFGVDGKALSTETPKVNGFSFVRTPSPAPGVDETPLMTWGQIESTPFRLDDEGTPIITTPGISYKFPKPSSRERLALKLASKDKIDKRHRLQREKPMEAVKHQLTSPLQRSGSLDRLQLLSPAAKKLTSTKLYSFGSDKRLAAYYSPVQPHRYLCTQEIHARTPDTSKNINTSDKKKLKKNFGC